MNSSPPKSINQVIVFLQVKKGETDLKFKFKDKKECYGWIKETTWNAKYTLLNKREKGKVIKYLSLITGYSEIHIKRLIKLAKQGKLYAPKSKRNQTSFKNKYIHNDIVLLAEMDNVAVYPNGNSLRINCKRMYEIFHDERFEKLSQISTSHIYNLRKIGLYRKKTSKYAGTKSVMESQIGIREKPNPDGKPGCLRVDSVHGGDKEGKKGVYYVNLVDEVTQSEITLCVEGISERFLADAWEDLLISFPFVIQQFHSDNGSEFINHVVAKILNKLNIRHSKSRPRHHNDNGLVECKNGWVIRKHFGYIHVPKKCAPIIQKFLSSYFNRYLNFHRICAFPVKTTLPNGEVVVKYPSEGYKTPYDKLKEIDPEGRYLRDGLSYVKLDRIAYEFSDFDFMKMMKKEYLNMRKSIKKYSDNLAVPDFSSVSFKD